jgi:hypothetical protein
MKIRSCFLIFGFFLLSYSTSYAEIKVQLQCRGYGSSKKLPNLNVDGRVSLTYENVSSGFMLLDLNLSNQKFSKNHKKKYFYNPGIPGKDFIHNNFMNWKNLNSIGARINSDLTDSDFLDKLEKNEEVSLSIAFYLRELNEHFGARLICRGVEEEESDFGREGNSCSCEPFIHGLGAQGFTLVQKNKEKSTVVPLKTFLHPANGDPMKTKGECEALRRELELESIC